ncbi:MAG: hypothetical protein ACP5IE_03170 [Infirmifilum sp.]
MGETMRLKNVMIRGVDATAYDEMSTLAKKMGVSVGALASQAFKVLLALADAGPQLAGIQLSTTDIIKEIIPAKVLKHKPVFVRHVGRLVLSREDLERAPGPLFLVGIEELVFDPSVDTRLFEEKVLRIVDCGRIVIHRGLDKLSVLARSLFIKELVEKI